MIFTYMNLGGLEIIVLLIIIMIPFVALVDILRSKLNPANKILWVLVVVFFNLIGALLYFIIGRKQRAI